MYGFVAFALPNMAASDFRRPRKSFQFPGRLEGGWTSGVKRQARPAFSVLSGLGPRAAQPCRILLTITSLR